MAGVETASRGSGPASPALREQADRVRPVTLAGEHLLPVLPALADLLPEGGLRRGATVAVGGPGGATSLALALAAAASAAGSWVAAVGLPSLGLLAAAELGVVLDRLALVAGPGAGSWAAAVAAVVDAVDVVLVRPGHRVGPTDARQLVARARERGVVLVRVGGPEWPEGPDVRLTVRSVTWHGLGEGYGHLRARRVEVVVEGRRAAARPRARALWLPGPGGEVVAAEPERSGLAAVLPLRGAGP